MNLFTPAETVANYAAAGVIKTRQPLLKLLLLGIAAGLFIGFPICVTNMAAYTVQSASAVRVLSGVLFAFGLGVVILIGAELFTGNTLIVISLLDKGVSAAAMLRNWCVVYIGNFLGALALSWACARFGWLSAGEGAPAAFSLRLALSKWGRYFLGNMLPVTLGNIVGGLLVGCTAWYCYLRKKG